MTEEQNSEIEFLTKRELIISLRTEKISVKPELEEKLKSFAEEDVLAVELEVNSPATFVGISLFNIPIVDFIQKAFEKDGIKKEVVNEAFARLLEG